MQVRLYKCADDKRKLKKTLTAEKSLDMTLLDDVSILNPELRVSHISNVLGYNYAYIPSLSRYYFINSITTEVGNTALISMSVDVLMTYSKSIGNISTLIERQENKVNRYMTDTLLPTVVSRKILRKNIGNIGDPSGANIALTVSGGAQ